MSWAFPRFLLIPSPWGLAPPSPDWQSEPDLGWLWSKERTVGPAWALPPSWPVEGGVPAARPHLCGPPAPTPAVRGGAAAGPAEARRVHVLHSGGPGRAVCPAHPILTLYYVE